MQAFGDPVVQRIQNQGRFATARQASDANEQTQRDGGVNPLKIVATGVFDGQQPLRVGKAQVLQPLNPLAASQIGGGQAVGVGHHLVGGSHCHDLAAVNARAWPHIHQIVGLAHRILIMFHHDHGVAQILKALQGVQQLLVVMLV